MKHVLCEKWAGVVEKETRCLCPNNSQGENRLRLCKNEHLQGSSWTPQCCWNISFVLRSLTGAAARPIIGSITPCAHQNTGGQKLPTMR